MTLPSVRLHHRRGKGNRLVHSNMNSEKYQGNHTQFSLVSSPSTFNLHSANFPTAPSQLTIGSKESGTGYRRVNSQPMPPKPKRERISFSNGPTKTGMPWGRFKHAKPKSAMLMLGGIVVFGIAPGILLLKK